MIISDIDVFLSCSFAADDAPINELVRSICRGVGLACVNVGAGFASVPPEKTVIERLGLSGEGLVRAGCACYTTMEEVRRLVDAVRVVAGER